MKTYCNIAVTLFALITSLIVTEARADREDYRVNDDYSIAEQNYPRVAVAADQTFVVVWSDKRSGGQDVYLQKFDVDGYPIGANLKVNDDSDQWTHQSDPVIATDITGQYSVVWRDYRDGQYPFDPEIYFQRFDSSVAPSGVNRSLTESVPDSLKESPDISLSPWGGGVIVWADYRTHNWDIYAQRISSVGTTIGTNFRVNDDIGIYQQHAPRVSVSPDGWFVVAWYDNRAGNDDIMAQIYDSLGTPIGTNFLAGSTNNTTRQAFPDVAADGTGHFSVVWVDWINGTYPNNADIYYRKFDTTGTSIGGIKQVNTDFSGRTQREAAISIDRIGHAAIVWADSGLTSWDIMGQMIDVEGAFKGVNFRVNNDADSAQQHPDVAVDGRRRYIAWADKRNGNYDIYASVETYNEPQLVPSVNSLAFQMDVSGGLPSAKTIDLDHAGYNSLNFGTVVSHDWIDVTPSSGTTPDQLSISITNETLGFGTYLGAITLVDLDNHDSSVVISVRLDVTAPEIRLSSDTVTIRAFAGIDENQLAHVLIDNAGSGSFNWTATESLDWLELSDYSGTDGSSVALMANAQSLTAGVHSGTIRFSSTEAYNSPDSLIVLIEVIDNMPYLRLTPDSIYAFVEDPSSYTAGVTIENIGAGSTNWSAEPSESWLRVTPTTGTDPESMTISLNADSLLNDLYIGYVDITDSASFSITERVTFVLDLLVPPPDTIRLGSAVTPLGAEGVIPIEFYFGSPVTGINLPLRFDSDALTVDSLMLVEPYASRFDISTTIDPAGYVTARMTLTDPSDYLLSGHHFVGELFYTAGLVDQVTVIDSVRTDTLRLSVTDTTGHTIIPYLEPGSITLGTPTGVDDVENNLLPNRIELHQNFPNPFNATTVISFDLPEGLPVRLEVYNILGQRVTTLVDRTIPAGRFSTSWDGSYPSGSTAPSGVYFYRLEAADITRVRKLVLLK